MLRIATILHPTDFSPQADHAFQLACSLARDHGGRIIALHVAELPLDYPGEAPLDPSSGGILEALAERLRAVRASDADAPVEHRLEEGSPVAEVLRVARETKCDLIVMGTHGRTGLGHLLMGSVAEQVVRKAACPVLVVKSPFVVAPSAGVGPASSSPTLLERGQW